MEQSEEKNLESDTNIHCNSDENDCEISDDSTLTMTYNNSNEDYYAMHGIKAVKTKLSPSNSEIVRTCKIVRNPNTTLSKLNEVDESSYFDIKQKISEYQQKITDLNLDENESKKERRGSVAKLKLDRVVKSRRPLFEKSIDNST